MFFFKTETERWEKGEKSQVARWGMNINSLTGRGKRKRELFFFSVWQPGSVHGAEGVSQPPDSTLHPKTEGQGGGRGHSLQTAHSSSQRPSRVHGMRQSIMGSSTISNFPTFQIFHFWRYFMRAITHNSVILRCEV